VSGTRVPAEFLPCRDYGHTWLPWDAVIESRPRRIRRILKCGKCGTKRTQTLDANYDVVGNTYSYPSGYQVKGRLTVSDKRVIREQTTPLFDHEQVAAQQN